MTPLGEYLKEARAARGLGLREFARGAGLSATEVSRLESGERQNPSIETLVRIAQALDLDLGRITELAAEPYICRLRPLQHLENKSTPLHHGTANRKPLD